MSTSSTLPFSSSCISPYVNDAFGDLNSYEAALAYMSNSSHHNRNLQPPGCVYPCTILRHVPLENDGRTVMFVCACAEMLQGIVCFFSFLSYRNSKELRTDHQCLGSINYKQPIISAQSQSTKSSIFKVSRRLTRKYASSLMNSTRVTVFLLDLAPFWSVALGVA